MLTSRIKDKPYWDLVYLLPISAVFLLAYLGHGSLATWDEAFYAQVAKETFRSGNWLMPTLDGEFWTDKPPLAVWVTAAFYTWFGINEFTSRLFSALCGIGVVLTTYFVGRKLLNRWAGFLGAMVLLSSSHFIDRVRFGMLDGPLTLFLSLALFFFWLGRERDKNFLWSGFFLGLAFMIKGLAAAMYFPIVGAYLIWSREWSVLRKPAYWWGIAVAVLMPVPWNVHVFMQAPFEYTSDIIRHGFLRTTGAIEGHVGNYYYYIRVLVNKYHPWVLIGIFSAPYFLYKAIRENEYEIIFLSLWMFVYFTVITLMGTKLAWYIVPLYPPLSLSIGYLLAKWIDERYKSWIKVIMLAVMLLHVAYSHIFDQDYAPQVKAMTPHVLAKKFPPRTTMALYDFHNQHEIAFYWDVRSIYTDTPAALETELKLGAPLYIVVQDAKLSEIAPLVSRYRIQTDQEAGNLNLLYYPGGKK